MNCAKPKLGILISSILLLLVIFKAESIAQEKDSVLMTASALREQLFPGKPLGKDYSFTFPQRYKEIYLQLNDGKRMHAINFEPSIETNGVILYLHGSWDALDVWGRVSPIYTDLGYNVFIIDYRGSGKSEGKVISEKEIHDDVQVAYDYLKNVYGEDKITVLGQSIGSGLASYLAANNKPKNLILQAPYDSIRDWIHHLDPKVKVQDSLFKLENYKWLKLVKCKITLIHGDNDKGVYYGSSLKLSKLLKPGDRFITLTGEGHTNFIENEKYRNVLRDILND